METENNGELRDDKGRFGKGNPGKPKGAITQTSAKVKESIVNFLENNIDAVQESFDQLGPSAKLKFIAEILPYAAPKLSSVQQEGNHNVGITIKYVDPGDYTYPTENKGSDGIPESL